MEQRLGSLNGDDWQAYRFRAPYYWKSSNEFSLELDAGLEAVSLASAELRKTWLGHAVAKWIVNDTHYLLLATGHDSLIPREAFPRAVEAPLSENYARSQWIAYWGQRWKSGLKFRASRHSNSNSELETDFEVLYRLQAAPAWLWLGVGGVVETNTNQNLGYWAPEQFFGYGPRFDVAQALNELWLLYVGGSLSIIQEKGFSNGYSHYVRAGLRYGKREANQIDLSYIDNRSRQGSDPWVYQGFQINLSLRF